MRLTDYLRGTGFTRSEHHQGWDIGRYVLAQANYGDLLRQRSAVAHSYRRHAAVFEDARMIRPGNQKGPRPAIRIQYTAALAEIVSGCKFYLTEGTGPECDSQVPARCFGCFPDSRKALNPVGRN
jgi:hypothetical protein